MGTRLKVSQYVRIIKEILNENKHETLELNAYRDGSMAMLTQVVNVLTSWGYCAVHKIKTRPDPFLKIAIKRTSDFQEKYDAFAKALQERRLERQMQRDAEQSEQKETKDEAASDEKAPEQEKKEDDKEATQ